MRSKRTQQYRMPGTKKRRGRRAGAAPGAPGALNGGHGVPTLAERPRLARDGWTSARRRPTRWWPAPRPHMSGITADHSQADRPERRIPAMRSPPEGPGLLPGSPAQRGVAPGAAPAAVRALCLWALAGLAFYLAWTGWSWIRAVLPDFEYFYKGGAWLLAHGGLDPGYDLLRNGVRQPRGSLEWYLPFVSRLMTLFAWAPFEVAGGAWLACNLAAFVALVRLMGRRLTDLPARDWPVTQLVPVLLMLLAWSWEFRLNQIDTLTLLMLVGSFTLWESGRRGVAGFWLGLATLVKITPALLIGWFLLKRQFRVVSVALLTILLAGPLSDALVFGPAHAADCYRAWLQRAAARSSQTGLILNQLEMDWRNQSLAAVASRWLHPTNFATHFDNDPRLRPPDPPATLNVVTLPRGVVAAIVGAISLASLLALAWIARRPAAELDRWRLRSEWVLFLLASLWLMPVLRRYHFVLAAPALSVLFGAMHFAGIRSRWTRAALACVGLFALTQFAVAERLIWGTKFMEGGGVLLLGLVLLATPHVLLVVGMQRGARPRALPVRPLPAADGAAAKPPVSAHA